MTTRHILNLVALLATIILVDPTYALTEAPASPAGSWTGVVNRVVDGDTITVDVGGLWQTVRIIGIDTPETVDPRKPVQGFGQEASDYTKRALLGMKVHLVVDPGNGHIQHHDRYGRLLAHVFVDGMLFSEAIVRDGYAHAYTKYPFRADYMERFRAAEREAREASRGLWGPQKADKEKAK